MVSPLADYATDNKHSFNKNAKNPLTNKSIISKYKKTQSTSLNILMNVLLVRYFSNNHSAP